MVRFQQDPKVIIYDIDEFLQNMPTDKIQEISFTQKDLHEPGEVSTTEILIRILVVKEYTDTGFFENLLDDLAVGGGALMTPEERIRTIKKWQSIIGKMVRQANERAN